MLMIKLMITIHYNENNNFKNNFIQKMNEKN